MIPQNSENSKFENLKHSNIIAKGPILRVPSMPNLHKSHSKILSKTSKGKINIKKLRKDEIDENIVKREEANKIINAPKGIGINEQNIYQIICKTSDHPQSIINTRERSQYLIEFYKGKLDEKAKEISRLRNQLRNLKSQIKEKCGRSQCRKARSASFGNSLNRSNQRSKSQSNLFLIKLKKYREIRRRKPKK